MNRCDLYLVSLDKPNASLCSTKWGVMSVLEDSKVQGDLVDIDYEIVHIIPTSDEIQACSVECVPVNKQVAATNEPNKRIPRAS